MEQWEYKVVTWLDERRLENRLNQLGSEGFRLVTTIPTMILMRPVAPTVAPSAPRPLSIQDDEIMTMDEVAQKLRVNLARAYELARSGGLPVVRLGRQLRVNRQALEEWLRESTKTPK